MIELSGRIGACNTASTLTSLIVKGSKMAKARICSAPNCGKKYYAKGYCTKHYALWKLHGDPHGLGCTKHGEPERYFRDVVLPYDGNDCLQWPFGKTPGGYGKLDGKIASRVLCEEVNGPPPTPKHDAAHSCGRGHLGCVTKRHLSWKTRAENMADQLTHGTRGRGEKNSMSKISDEDAAVIREIAPFAPYTLISDHYGISVAYVGKIVSGYRRGNV